MCRALVARTDCELHVRASAPHSLWPRALEPATASRDDRPCDVGVVQSDDLTVDIDATRCRLESWAEGYDARVEEEAGWLRRAGLDLVVGDVPPLAFSAAALAGLPSVAFANFSWDWIYERMGFEDAARAAARAYASADLLVELSPAAPMPAFARRVGVGVVGRRSDRTGGAVRRRLGLAPTDRMVVVAFRSHWPAMLALPPRRAAVRYAVSEPRPDRDDVLVLERDVDFLDALAAADAVVAKPGYGIIGDVSRVGARLLYAERTGFPEDPVLRAWLETRQGTMPVRASSLASGRWAAALQALLELPRPRPAGDGPLQAACAELEAVLTAGR